MIYIVTSLLGIAGEITPEITSWRLVSEKLELSGDIVIEMSELGRGESRFDMI